MSLNLVMAFAFVYGLTYQALARGLIGRVMDADPEYRGRWRKPGFYAHPGTSLAVLHILFSMDLPKPSYPRRLRWQIWVSRIMLWLWPLVLFALLAVPEFFPV